MKSLIHHHYQHIKTLLCRRCIIDLFHQSPPLPSIDSLMVNLYRHWYSITWCHSQYARFKSICLYLLVDSYEGGCICTSPSKCYQTLVSIVHECWVVFSIWRVLLELWIHFFYFMLANSEKNFIFIPTGTAVFNIIFHWKLVLQYLRHTRVWWNIICNDQWKINVMLHIFTWVSRY